MKLYRGSVHLSRLVDSDIFLHLVGRVGLLNGRDWFRVCRSDSLIGALWVYLTGEGGRRAEKKRGETIWLLHILCGNSSLRKIKL